MRFAVAVLIPLISGIAAAAPAPRRAEPVVTPVSRFTEHTTVSPVLYLNRCVGGCVVHRGTSNDAADSVSTIPSGTATDYTLSEFSGSDADWTAIVQCVTDVYSPYHVTVTDQQPAGSFNEAMVAGLPMELGQPADVLGIAPLAEDCSAQANAISFTFANAHPAPGFVDNVCWTASQESSHVYGLDHEYQYTDGTSACNDPMTYRTECGVGEKFFRDKDAQCGEYAVRACKCNQTTQNSAARLLAVFGPGTPTTSAPTVALTFPADGSVATTGQAVHATASAQRGIASVDLLLNGYPWTSTPGTEFETTGSPASDYPLVFPPTVPDGIIDIQVRANDDLGVSTLTDPITVTKGAPCADATTCLKGQSCDAGKCEWPTPTAKLGDSCDFPQECTTGHCDGTPAVCTQPCTVSGTGSNGCPAGYGCEGDLNGGACLQTSSAGCRATADRSAAPPVGALALVALTMLVVLRRQRFQ